MTPKEKANELGNKFYQGSFFDYDKKGHIEECERAKERAIICVDEILKTKVGELTEEEIECLKDIELFIYRYWQEVKKEIKEL